MNAREYNHQRKRFWQDLASIIKPTEFYESYGGDFKDVTNLTLSGLPGRLQLRFRGTPHGFKLWVHWVMKFSEGTLSCALHPDGTFRPRALAIARDPAFVYKQRYVCGLYRADNLADWRAGVVAIILQAVATCAPQRLAHYRQQPFHCPACPHELTCLLSSK